MVPKFIQCLRVNPWTLSPTIFMQLLQNECKIEKNDKTENEHFWAYTEQEIMCIQCGFLLFQSFPFGDCMKFALGTFNPWGMEPLAFHAMKIRFHEAVTLAISMER